PTAPARRRRWVPAVVGVAALAAGVAGGLAAEDARTDPHVEVADASGYLSVVVPPDWHRAVADDGWDAPQDGAGYPALSVGSTRDWADPERRGEGVFVGLMPGDALPEQLPGHPECGTTGGPVTDEGDQPSTTVMHTDCPGGVTAERVVQVAANRLLWVQVRSADTATANRVLDSVETHGL
ncbi:hypothetical protein, partial [Nocardioides dongkuii]